MRDNILSHTLWIALWHHRHGVDPLPFMVPSDRELTEQEVIEWLGEEFEPEREEYIELSRIADRALIFFGDRG